MTQIKKIALASILVAGLALGSTIIHAEGVKFSPYVGGELGFLSADYKTYEGIKFADYLQTNTGKKYEDASVAGGSSGVDVSTKLKLKGIHIDVVGKHAINEKVDLLASIGVARLKADITATVSSGTLSAEANDDESDTAFVLFLPLRSLKP